MTRSPNHQAAGPVVPCPKCAGPIGVIQCFGCGFEIGSHAPPITVRSYSMPHQAAGDEGRLAGVDPTFLGHLIRREGHSSIFIEAGEPVPLTSSSTVSSVYDGPSNVTRPVVSGEQEKGGVVERLRAAVDDQHLLPGNLIRDAFDALSTPSEPVAWGYAVRRVGFPDGVPVEGPWHLEFPGVSLEMAKAQPEQWEVQPLYALTGESQPSRSGR